jgi:hypothetical protein
MRRRFALLAAITLLAAVGAQAGTRPVMRATRVAPLTVVGLQFPHSAWLRVTASSGATRQTKVVRTSTVGRFGAAFSFRVVLCRQSAVVIARRMRSSTILAELKVSPGKC